MIGKIFEIAKVPVGAIWSSPSCRAKQTAELAFGRIDAISDGLVHTVVTNIDNADKFSKELHRVLTTIPIEPGKNAIITAHANTLEFNENLFSSGAKRLSQKPMVTETGFYMIRRGDDGKLHLVYKFPNLGALAAAAIDLPIRKY